MAKIMLGEGYRNLRVGPNQLLRIKKATYDEKFMTAVLVFEDADGRTLSETYRLMGAKEGEMNPGALNALSTVAKCATKDHKNREIDPVALKGLYITGDVVENVERDDKGEPTGRTFLHIRNADEADGEFEGREDDEDEPEEPEEPGEASGDDDDFDLDEFIG